MEWQIIIDGKIYDGIIGDRNYDSNNIIADNEPVADSLNKIAKEEKLIELQLKAEKSKLDELAKILRRKRMAAGAISFDKVEVKFNLNIRESLFKSIGY